MWIAACTCGTGITAETEADAVSLAETHLMRAAVPGPGESWAHAVSLGEATNACRLTPSWGSTVPGRVEGNDSTPAISSSGSAGALSPAEIMKLIKKQELKYTEEDEDFEVIPRTPARKNPYTVDPDPKVDLGFRDTGAYKEVKSGKVEDFSGWGGPGAPPGDDEDPDEEFEFSIDPVEASTRLDELPEGIVLNGQAGTGKIEPLITDVDASDYDTGDMPRPTWPGDDKPGSDY